MDVDFLRPRTVPISPETILWFEFLLDPDLLEKHLLKSNPDPSPSELIVKFLSITPETHDNKQDDANKTSSESVLKKQVALKILSLKVAAFLKWDINVLESELPFQKQIHLLKDLISMCTGQDIPIPLPPDFLKQKSLIKVEEDESIKGENEDAMVIDDGVFTSENARFALTLYHRWILRIQVFRGLQPRNNKTTYVHVPGLQDSNLNQFTAVDDTFLANLNLFTQASIDYLSNLSNERYTPFKCLSYKSFVPLSENTEHIEQTFNGGFYISEAELKSQIHFDMAAYFLFTKDYNNAKKHILICKEHYDTLKEEYGFNLDDNIEQVNYKDTFKYCTLSKADVEGYLEACIGQCGGLFQQMNASILNQYIGIIGILEQDNILREIPLFHRVLLELDIKGAIASKTFTVARDLIFRVEVLNTVRQVLEDSVCIIKNEFIERLKTGGERAINILITAFKAVLPKATAEEKENIECYLLQLGSSVKDLLPYLKELSINSSNDTENIQTFEEIQDDWNTDVHKEFLQDFSVEEYLRPLACPRETETRRRALEAEVLGEELLQCMTADGVRKLLVKLVATNPVEPLWKMSRDWNIPIPLQSVVMSLPTGFLQDFSYILLAKSKQLLNLKDYSGAVSLLSVLERETRDEKSSLITKLGRLISYEILLVQSTQFLDEWPKKCKDVQNLGTRCRECLSSLQLRDNVLPRIEVKEHAAAVLLNMCEWEPLLSLERQYCSLELCSVVAHAASDLTKYKGNKKLNRDAWDLILPMFANGAPKRNNSGAIMHRDSPISNNRENLFAFISRIKETTVLTVVISLLARIHNVLKDEANMELNMEHTALWPAMISNSNSYNIRTVAEALKMSLNEAVRLYPNNDTWIKLQGDFDYVNGYYESAMQKYVKSIIVGSEYLTILPLTKPLVDDQLIRRMIKISSNLGCHAQAAVLCQFLDETDYGLAFKSLSEKSNSFDAMDAYYSFVWEPALLEYIVSMHHKRGETKRRQQAISLMGLLELNSNNNEEIQREAAAIRKCQFLRALDRQYRQ